MLTREKVLKKAYHDCMFEMYEKSQPSADYDNLIEEYKTGKIGKDERVYDRHYLSMEEFEYIIKKYRDAYNIKKTWIPNIETLENLLKDGGMKDKYIHKYTDENGNYHPGYRSAENVEPLKNLINNYLSNTLHNDNTDEITNDIVDIVMSTINGYKNFYKFDREEDEFNINVTLGASPSSNPDTVKKWWKDNYNKDIEIEERNPKLFWYRDMEYTDEDMEDEFDDPNWKEILDKEWKEEKEKHTFQMKC